MVEAGIDFYFRILKQVFTVWLVQFTVFGVPVIYVIIAVIIFGIVVSGLLNGVRS